MPTLAIESSTTPRARRARGRWCRNQTPPFAVIWPLLTDKRLLSGVRFRTVPPQHTSHTCPRCGSRPTPLAPEGAQQGGRGAAGGGVGVRSTPIASTPPLNSARRCDFLAQIQVTVQHSALSCDQWSSPSPTRWVWGCWRPAGLMPARRWREDPLVSWLAHGRPRNRHGRRLPSCACAAGCGGK
jgi:hypothetical protein